MITPTLARRLTTRLLLIAVCLLFAPWSATGAADEQITLNLQDKDLAALINTVAEVTDRNFVVDPRVKAKVTVISKRAMNANELYQVFLSILQVHGFSAIPSGEVTKIVPDVNAKQLGVDNAQEGPGGDEIVTQVIPVEHVPVAELVPILRPLIPQQGHFAAYPPTNVLIISDRASNVGRVRRIIDRIDTESSDKLEVIELQHASATEMVRILQSLQQNDTQQGGAPPVQLAADERTNSILMSGDKSKRLRLRSMIAHLDTPLERGGDTQVVYLRYSKATELADVLRGVSENIKAQQGANAQQGASSSSSGSNEDVSIQADEATNSLVISAPPKIQDELQTVIQQLDVRRAQVLIEAAIAEVSMDTAAELGLQWAVDGSESQNSAIGGTSFDAAGGASLSSILTSIANDTAVDPGSGLSLAIGDLASGTRFATLLRALASDTNTNILSTPTLTTLDNEEAEIRVAENVPFVTGSYSSSASSGTGANAVNPFQTIERQDVGLILKVTPQINEGDSVMLDLEQEVSSVSQSTQAVDLITNKRSIKTSVLVDDGKLIILGGLIDEQVREREQSVPLLGDIPLLGELFRYRSSDSSKRNLMVFLRPRIIRDTETMTRYATRKYNYIRAEQIDKRERGVSLLPNDSVPVLPPLEVAELPPPFDPVP